MYRIIGFLLIVAGIIHLLPLAGVLGAEQLARLYGLRIDEPNLAILMRHRAIVLAALGALMVWAAFRVELRLAALVLGLASALSFLWLTWSIGNYNAQLTRVLVADVVASGCLLLGLGIQLFSVKAA
jgi:hypothetical protein